MSGPVTKAHHTTEQPSMGLWPKLVAKNTKKSIVRPVGSKQHANTARIRLRLCRHYWGSKTIAAGNTRLNIQGRIISCVRLNVADHNALAGGNCRLGYQVVLEALVHIQTVCLVRQRYAAMQQGIHKLYEPAALFLEQQNRNFGALQADASFQAEILHHPQREQMTAIVRMRGFHL